MRRASRRTTRAVASFVGAALLAVGCTNDEPEPAASPPPAEDPDPEPTSIALGTTVGVVLPPADQFSLEVAGVARADVGKLASARGGDLDEVQPYIPDSRAFVEDLGRLLANRRTSLTCVLGDEAVTVTRSLAETYPDLRFCAAPVPAAADLPDTVHGIEIRAEEVGYLVGVAVAAAAPEGRVGIALSGADLPAARFRAGLLYALQDVEVEIAEVVPDEGGTVRIRPAVRDLVRAGVDVVVMDAAADAAEAVELVVGTTLVAMPAPLAQGGLGATETVVNWRVHWDEILGPAITELLDDRLEDEPAARRSVGVRDGVVSANVGAAASPEVRRALDQARTALERGEVELRDLETRQDPPPATDDGSTIDPTG